MAALRLGSYAIFAVTLVTTVVLGEVAPPCDLIDGPCYENWASDPALAGSLAVLAMAPFIVVMLSLDIGRGIVRWRNRRFDKRGSDLP